MVGAGDGVECLAAACRHAGAAVGAEELRGMVGAAVSLDMLARAARRLGFRAVAESWTVDELFEHGAALAGRTLIEMASGGFAVLAGVRRDGVTVSTPAGGGRPETRRLTRLELPGAWAGRLLVLRGVPGGGHG